MKKLFVFLSRFFLDNFFGTVTIRFERGKVTHVEVETKRVWTYRDLPQDEEAPGIGRAGRE